MPAFTVAQAQPEYSNHRTVAFCAHTVQNRSSKWRIGTCTGLLDFFRFLSRTGRWRIRTTTTHTALVISAVERHTLEVSKTSMFDNAVVRLEASYRRRSGVGEIACESLVSKAKDLNARLECVSRIDRELESRSIFRVFFAVELPCATDRAAICDSDDLGRGIVGYHRYAVIL